MHQRPPAPHRLPSLSPLPRDLRQRRRSRADLPGLQGERGVAGGRCRVFHGAGRGASIEGVTMAHVIDLPPSETLRPDQVVGELAKVEWQQVIGVGITAAGEFEVINSEMTAERALWLIEWAKRWAMGLEVEE